MRFQLPMKIAAIADIHGNHLALEAVLDDLAHWQPDEILHLGDAFNGPLDPAAVAHRLRPLNAHHLRGNGERMVLSDGARGVSRSARFARERLSAEELRWIADWPSGLTTSDWQAFHGSPSSDTEYLLEEVAAGGVSLRRADAIAERVGPTSAAVLICAHTHLPRVVTLPDGRLVVNPGSVGLPAYADDVPFPHRMETGSPHARYALLEKAGPHWSVALRAVAYEWNEAAAVAERHGFPDWARALRTGYA